MSIATQPAHLSVSVCTLLINDVVWVHLPGEVFTDLSCRIQEQSTVSITVVTPLADHFIGYIPDREDVVAVGYASMLTPRILPPPPFSATARDALVEGAVQLLQRLGGSK